MVGTLVRERRRGRGWSQIRLATETGLTQNYVSRIERGEVDLPQRATLERLGAALGIALPEFYRAAGVLEPAPEAPPPPNIDDAILADMLAELRRLAPSETLEVLRELREVEPDGAYRQAVRLLVEAMRANMHMGGRMLRLDWPGRERD